MGRSICKREGVAEGILEHCCRPVELLLNPLHLAHWSERIDSMWAAFPVYTLEWRVHL